MPELALEGSLDVADALVLDDVSDLEALRCTNRPDKVGAMGAMHAVGQSIQYR